MKFRIINSKFWTEKSKLRIVRLTMLSFWWKLWAHKSQVEVLKWKKLKLGIQFFEVWTEKLNLSEILNWKNELEKIEYEILLLKNWTSE